jgi:signal transduction histidine kinase
MSKHDGYDNFSSAGSNYHAAYSTLPRLNVALAVARNQSKLMSSAHSWGITGLATALLAALAAAFVLDRYVQKRTRSIARVSEDLSAIAKGELDRRIILQSSDDARGLADNINVVTERLRAQIAREEESRQFESFIRLSAMLTHDLKNAIESLSLTVGNMERHFDNPEFRTDALKGLTSATDKLKAIVARLARPLTSLSGEHKRPTNVDLVPILKRVIAMTAEPSRNKHKIVTRLPPSLYALVDPARIEEVIENLLLNALEAMSEKSGTLTIEAGLTDKGAPSFSISDTGQGMSKSFIESRLFRPFSTTKRTGIGLGLYTCREVIQASAGSIEVESVEGAGTTFRVVLPSIPHDRRN